MLRLTISGLCLIVMEGGGQPQPANPTSVDVYCVDTHGHKPRLSFRANDLSAWSGLTPELQITAAGDRIGCVSIDQSVIEHQNSGPNKPTQFNVQWSGTTPGEPMTNILSTGNLGVHQITSASADELPTGASALLRLDYGSIFAREIIKDESGKTISWSVAHGAYKELAEFVVLEADNLTQASFSWPGRHLLFTRQQTVEVCLTNDITEITPSYHAPQTALNHLGHIKGVAEGNPTIHIPKVHTGSARTGHPICPTAYHVS